MRDTIRLGTSAVSVDSLRAGVGYSARVVEHHMAMWSVIGAVGATTGGSHERSLHQPLRSPETVYNGWVPDYRNLGSDYWSLG